MLQKRADRPLGIKQESIWSGYFADIFRDARRADGAVCIFSDKNHNKNLSYVKASEMYLRGPRELARHDRRDAFFSFASFRESTQMKHSIHNLSNIFAWSIDVDYKRKDLAPLDVLQYILDTVSIPVPNYAEYGHRLRLIYLLEEPLRIMPSNKKALLSGFSFMQKSIANMINAEIDWANAESCSVTSFFRVPGSINTKTKDVIAIKHLTDERWTMQEIFSEWIPNQLIDKSGCSETWKADWKIRKQSKNRKWNHCDLWNRRMEVFKQLRSMDDIPREKLCFLYGISCLQTYKASTTEEAMEEIVRFNEGFTHPLCEKEIRSKFRTIKAYAYTEKTISEFLGIEIGQVFNRKQYDADRYQAKRQSQIEKGNTKKQQVERRRELIIVYLSKHLSIQDIASKLNLSVSTIRRDVAYIHQNKDFMYQPIHIVNETEAIDESSVSNLITPELNQLAKTAIEYFVTDTHQYITYGSNTYCVNRDTNYNATNYLSWFIKNPIRFVSNDNLEYVFWKSGTHTLLKEQQVGSHEEKRRILDYLLRGECNASLHGKIESYIQLEKNETPPVPPIPIRFSMEDSLQDNLIGLCSHGWNGMFINGTWKERILQACAETIIEYTNYGAYRKYRQASA